MNRKKNIDSLMIKHDAKMPHKNTAKSGNNTFASRYFMLPTKVAAKQFRCNWIQCTKWNRHKNQDEFICENSDNVCLCVCVCVCSLGWVRGMIKYTNTKCTSLQIDFNSTSQSYMVRILCRFKHNLKEKKYVQKMNWKKIGTRDAKTKD